MAHTSSVEVHISNQLASALPPESKEVLVRTIKRSLAGFSYKSIYIADLGSKYMQPSAAKINEAIDLGMVENNTEHLKNSAIIFLGSQLSWDNGLYMTPFKTKTMPLGTNRPRFFGTLSLPVTELVRGEGYSYADSGIRNYSFGDLGISRVGRAVFMEISLLNNPQLLTPICLYAFIGYILKTGLGARDIPYPLTPDDPLGIELLNHQIRSASLASLDAKRNRAMNDFQQAERTLQVVLARLTSVENLRKQLSKNIPLLNMGELLTIPGISAVELNLSGDLDFITKPLLITLPNGQVPIGRYRLTLDVAAMFGYSDEQERNTGIFHVYGVEEIKQRSNPHPYMSSSGGTCFGGFGSTITSAIRDGDVKTLLYTTLEWLQSYDPTNPFTHLYAFLPMTLGVVLTEDETMLFAKPATPDEPSEVITVSDVVREEEYDEVYVDADDFIEVAPTTTTGGFTPNNSTTQGTTGAL